MDQIDDPDELERQIEQAKRLASRTTDLTTYQRLREFVEELRHTLRLGCAALQGRNQRAPPANFGSSTAARPDAT
jgi:signal transduction histidine kinase